MGRHVSGRNRRATRKANTEIISVIHSVQRQPSDGVVEIQPPAMGAIAGAEESQHVKPR
jgi:hypothetical protein